MLRKTETSLDIVTVEALHPSINLADLLEGALEDASQKAIIDYESQNLELSLWNLIGHGQKSTVWLARDIKTGEWYALKSLSESALSGQCEADNLNIAGQLVAAHQSLESSHPYVSNIVMHLAKGISLSNLEILVKQKKFPAPSPIEYCNIAISAFTQLEKLHDANLVHNNLKANKIFYEPLTRQTTIIGLGQAISTQDKSLREKDIRSMAYALDRVSGVFNYAPKPLENKLSDILQKLREMKKNLTSIAAGQYKTGIVDIAEYQSENEQAIEQMEGKFHLYNEIVLIDTAPELQRSADDYCRFRQHLLTRTSHPAIRPEILRPQKNQQKNDFMRYLDILKTADSRIRVTSLIASDKTENWIKNLENLRWANSVIDDGHDPKTSLPSIKNRYMLNGKRKHEESLTTDTEQSIGQTASQQRRQ